MAFTHHCRIEPHQIDSSLRVRLAALGDLILQAGGEDADMLGFGVGDLNAGVGDSGVGASWVLSRMAIEVRRLPVRHEHISIHTWISDYGRLVTTRNMSVVDEAGEEICAAVTQWAMIDLATRRPMDLSALSNKNSAVLDRQPPIERPRKIGASVSGGIGSRGSGGVSDGASRSVTASGGVSGVGSREEGVFEHEHRVVYSDIDFNGHVNSMKYIEWMVDAMPVDAQHPEALSVGARSMGAARTGDPGHAGNISPITVPLRLDINYLHEARLGELLSICRTEIPGTEIFGADTNPTPGMLPVPDTNTIQTRALGENQLSGERQTHNKNTFDIRNAEGVSICRACLARN